MRDWADNLIAVFLVLRVMLVGGAGSAGFALPTQRRIGLGGLGMTLRVSIAMRRRVSGGRSTGACGGVCCFQ
jgi:hypothetical protein